jgi:hypothetical protein
LYPIWVFQIVVFLGSVAIGTPRPSSEGDRERALAAGTLTLCVAAECLYLFSPGIRALQLQSAPLDVVYFGAVVPRAAGLGVGTLLSEAHSRVIFIAPGAWRMRLLRPRLQRAAYWGRAEAVRRLVEEGKRPDDQDSQGWTGLHRAAASGRDAVIRALIDAGANVDIADHDGRTSLHWAAWAGWPRAAGLLISHGADPDGRDARQSTPLHYAAWARFADVAQLLICRGADVNARGSRGHSPLHVAAELGDSGEEMVELLLARGADANIRTDHGATPLHLAATTGFGGEAVRALLRHGADASAKDADGRTPADWVHDRRSDIRRLLEQR